MRRKLVGAVLCCCLLMVFSSYAFAQKNTDWIIKNSHLCLGEYAITEFLAATFENRKRVVALEQLLKAHFAENRLKTQGFSIKNTPFHQTANKAILSYQNFLLPGRRKNAKGLKIYYSSLLSLDKINENYLIDYVKKRLSILDTLQGQLHMLYQLKTSIDSLLENIAANTISALKLYPERADLLFSQDGDAFASIDQIKEQAYLLKQLANKYNLYLSTISYPFLKVSPKYVIKNLQYDYLVKPLMTNKQPLRVAITRL